MTAPSNDRILLLGPSTSGRIAGRHWRALQDLAYKGITVKTAYEWRSVDGTKDYARWKLILPTTQHIQLNVQIVNEEQFPINHLHLSLIPE